MASGFIILDKPSSITSRQAGYRVAKMFNVKKFGHVGTLDPMASGLIVIALGEATKMIPFLDGGDMSKAKEYLFSIKWGIQTDTGDITGNIMKISDPGLRPSLSETKDVLPGMIGEYDQMPPAFSAKKINGVPAYKLARKGADVELKPKRVRIYELEIMRNAECGREDSEIFRVKCSSGTYIRSLVQDMASKVDVHATCSMIRRTQTNGFHIKDAVTLDFLENLYNNGGAIQDCLKSPDFGLDDIPVLYLDNKDSVLFQNGGFISVENTENKTVRVYSNEKFIGIGMVENGILKPKRIILCR